MDTVCEQAVNGAGVAVYNWSMAAEPKTFGDRVAWLLRRRRTDTLPISSQKELAAAMRVSPQYLNALMGGRRTPNVQHLRAAAAALGTSVSYLALATDDPSPDVAADEVYDDEDGAGISPAAADAAQQRGSRADMLAEVAARGPAMLTTDDTAAANAWLRRYVRVFVRDNQVTEVRFAFW